MIQLNNTHYTNLFFRRRVVLIAAQDDASRYISVAFKELRKIGARRILKRNHYRSSLALVGYVGFRRRPSWSKQVQNRRKRGPSSLSVLIRFPGESLRVKAHTRTREVSANVDAGKFILSTQVTQVACVCVCIISIIQIL